METPIIRTFKWNRNQMEKVQKALEDQLISKHGDQQQVQASITVYDKLLGKLTGFHHTVTNKVVKPKEALAQSKEQLESFCIEFPEANQYLHYIQAVAHAAQDLVLPSETNYYQYGNSSNNGLFQIVKGFFKYFDSSLCPLFEALFDNEKLLDKGIDYIDIREKGAGYSTYFQSGCYFDFANRRPYISLVRKNTMEDVYGLVHEVMHGMGQVINPNTSACPNLVQTILSEVGPYFAEFVMDDYLIEEKKVSPQEIATFRKLRLQQTDMRARLIYNGLTVAQSNDKSTLSASIIPSKEKGFEDYIKYMLSYFIALDLYLQYSKVDKKIALDHLKTILLYQGDKLEDILGTIGIDYLSYLTLDNYKTHVEEVQQQLDTKIFRK